MMIRFGILFFVFAVGCFGLTVDTVPATLIAARDSSGLDRPEGVSFTPSGDFIAVANSLANTVTFYRRIGESGAAYETVPSFSIGGSESQLNYPHDLSFSPDGERLAIANRHGNSITIYRKNHDLNRYDPIPVAKISGAPSQIKSPDAVKYSPVDNVIAVANMQSSTVTFYAFEGDRYQKQPFQVIKGSILKIPDGLSFSKDGNLLAVTSHDAHAVVIYKKKRGAKAHSTYHQIQILQGNEAGLCYPHSIAFHPFNNDIFVTCSQGRDNVRIFSTSAVNTYSNAPEESLEILEMYDASTISFVDQLRQEGGVKGIAISSDGNYMAVTQNLAQDELMLSYPVGVLVIYPIQQ